MARSKRRSFRRSSSPSRPKADWVYRGDVHDAAAGLIDTFGTYTPGGSFSQTPGIAAASVHWLYDSHNYRSFTAGQPGNLQFRMPSHWRAEGRNPLCLRVQGWIGIGPSTWALGSFYWLGIRFGVFTQNAQTGNAVFPVQYSMWSYPADDMLAPARFANDRSWFREFRHVEHFNDNSMRKNLRFNIKLRRRLKPNEGLGMYTETADGSVNINITTALRTLVVDEG